MTLAPYYQDRHATLYLGDCREVAPQLARGSVDLMVTDPPYGIAFKGRAHNFATMDGDTDPTWVPDAIATCLRALRGNRHLYVFGRWDLSALPVTEPCELVWDKGHAGIGQNGAWSRSHELITFTTFTPSRSNRERGDGRLAVRMRRASVLRVPRLNSRQNSRHPTEKPVLLLRQLIESSSVIGETVFDPFAGSGSTLEAAIVEGRQAVGIEVDERYAEVAAQRLAALDARV